MSANGLYDPDITNVGHQPMYFDQFAALYNHYVVIGSKCTVKFVPSSVTSAPCYVGLMLNDDTVTATADITAVMENSQGKAVKLIAAGQSNQSVISKSFSAKKIFGPGLMANTELQGTPASNPAEQTYYDIVVQATSTNTVLMVCMITVEYIVVWKELKEVAQS